jgi:hypothetical protein
MHIIGGGRDTAFYLAIPPSFLPHQNSLQTLISNRSNFMRFLENIANPKIRNVIFAALSPAFMVLFASGLDLDRTAPGWWIVFLILAVVWSIAFLPVFR